MCVFISGEALTVTAVYVGWVLYVAAPAAGGEFLEDWRLCSVTVCVLVVFVFRQARKQRKTPQLCLVRSHANVECRCRRGMI